jgi:hypothetical protein
MLSQDICRKCKTESGGGKGWSPESSERLWMTGNASCPAMLNLDGGIGPNSIIPEGCLKLFEQAVYASSVVNKGVAGEGHAPEF